MVLYELLRRAFVAVRRDDGATMAEYAIILALIVVVAIGVLTGLGEAIVNALGDAADAIGGDDGDE